MAVFLSAGLTASDFSAQSPPPGTVHLEPSLIGINHAEFIDETVISIRDWLLFMHWTRREYGGHSVEFQSILPDSVILLKALPNADPMLYTSAYRHPSFGTYPMVGISYEQAIMFCTWRTERANELFEIRGIEHRVLYSLPTKEDFAAAKQNVVLNIGADVQELTAGRAVLQIEQAGELNFQPYQGADALIGFRCVAKITSR